MEFSEKLQNLRKGKGLTQDELANKLFVSRTAVSKWESGRGYPNIDSLKAIAKIFDTSIDALLSSSQLLDLAEQDKKENKQKLKNFAISLLDCLMVALFFLPLFGVKQSGVVLEYSLIGLRGVKTYLIVAYYVVSILPVLCGTSCLIFKYCNVKISLALSVLATIIFIATTQVYACVFVFLLLVIKMIVLLK